MKALLTTLIAIRKILGADTGRDVLGFIDGCIVATDGGGAGTLTRCEYPPEFEGLSLVGWLLNAPDAERGWLIASNAHRYPGWIELLGPASAYHAGEAPYRLLAEGTLTARTIKSAFTPPAGKIEHFSSTIKHLSKGLAKIPRDEHKKQAISLAQLDALINPRLKPDEVRVYPAHATAKHIDAALLLRALKSAAAPAKDAFFTLHVGAKIYDPVVADVHDIADEHREAGRAWIMPMRV